LHAQVLAFPSLCAASSSSSPPLLQNNNNNNNKTPAKVESYAFVLSACLRAGGVQGHDAASLLLEKMKEEKIAPTLFMYRELAKACLVVIEKEEGEREEGRAMEVFREVVAMVPAGEEEGGAAVEAAAVAAATQPRSNGSSTLLSSSPSSTTTGKRLTVKCKSEGEARWVQQLLAAKAAGDVEQALFLFAQGLTAFCCSGREGGSEGGREEEAGAFACNVVLSTCIKAEKWREAGQVSL